MADGLRYAAFGAALSFGLASAAAVPCDGLSQGKPEKIPIRPGVDVEIEVPAASKGMLIEEFGGDLQVRAGSDAEFVDISIRPPRLGIAAVRSGSSRVTVRLNPAHAASSIVVTTRCANEGDLRFFEALQRRYVEQIAAGADRAKAAIPQIERELATVTNLVQRAWLMHALANATLSAGQHDQSAKLFELTRAAWQAAGEPARAAVALTAIGEDLSRAGEFDEAESALEVAQAELKTAGQTYYELRARTQRCLILSRRGLPTESVRCEAEVADRYEELGELAAAAASGISIANLWMKLGNLKSARERLLRIDAYRASLLPVTRAKLHEAFGTYYLQTGELDSAARELLAASTQMAEIGLPSDQAVIDLKLAGVALQAGAYAEELRLLERALSTVGNDGPPEIVSAIALRAASAYLVQGNFDEAVRHLATADAICARMSKLDCEEQVRQTRVLLWLQTHETEKARVALMSAPVPKLAITAVSEQLLAARLQIVDSDPEGALKLLDEMPREVANPELQLNYDLLRAQALVASGQRQAALQWLQLALARTIAQTSALDAVALRASARHRITGLQSALFDFIEPETNGEVSASTMATVRGVIDLANPLWLLNANRISSRLPEAMRQGLSAAVADGKPVDQRQLFLSFAVAGNEPSPAATGTVHRKSQPAQGVTKSDSSTVVLIPLPGQVQFRLLALKDGLARQCLAMSRAEFDELTARFEAALDGRETEIAGLDSAAQRWYDAVMACQPQVSRHWDVVANSGSRSLPWAWIAARADARGQTEPSVSVRFDTSPDARPALRPRATSVLNLDISGDAVLPFAATEANRVSAVMTKAGVPVRTLAASQITVESLFAELSDGGAWIHLIGHGNPASYGSLYAGLWLPGPEGPLLIAFPEIASATLTADLVILSACGDAKGDRGFAGSRLRTAEGLLAAGVGAVVASSNPASDAAAPFWTARFYESLLAQGDVPIAAQSARRALRQSPHFRHPKYWAGIDSYTSH